MGRDGEYFCKLLFLFFVQEILTAGLFCWLSINSWIPFFCRNHSFDYTKCSTTQPWASQKKVFSIITYYMCLANQKHLWWIWLKQPQNNSKIRLTHAGSLHTHWKLHCTIVAVGPFEAVFLAGHICGNEYQICFCSHKSKPSAPFLKSIQGGSVYYTYTHSQTLSSKTGVGEPFKV